MCPYAHGAGSLAERKRPWYKDAMERIFLGIGSNIGDRTANITGRAASSGRPPGSGSSMSSLIETRPVGYEEQPRLYQRRRGN